MNVRYVTNSSLLPNALFTMKSMRNATAHNNIIFDARFKDHDVDKNLIHWVEVETNITDINFPCQNIFP